jgi:CHAT domain-containing protein/tetratricopeptide (TPR) repeat protein
MIKKSQNNKPIDEQQQQADQYWSQAEKFVTQGHYLEAAQFYEKSAEAEQASPNPRLTKAVESLNIAGYCYDQICQYTKALQLYEHALELAQKLGWDAGIAPVLRNIGTVYEAWGQYANALDYFEQALELNRQLGQEADVAKALNNIGRVYKAWGQYANALDYYEQALALNRRLGQDADIATVLRNIGVVYHSWGQYVNALEYYEQALKLNQQLGRNTNIATVLNNIGRVYLSWGRCTNALEYFEQALLLAQKLSREADIARCFNNIGVVYHSWSQYTNALAYYEQALELNQQLGRDAVIASDLTHIGEAYYSWGQYINALKYHEQALALAQQLGRDADTAKSLDNIGRVYYALKNYPEAITYLVESLEIKERLRKTATGDVRRDYLASQIYTYQFLASCYVRTDDFSCAFETIELSRARRLAEQLAGSDADISIPSIQHIQNTIPQDTAVLIYANIDLPDVIGLLITKEHVMAVELPKSEFIREVMDFHQQEIEKALTDGSKIKQKRIIKKDKEGFIIACEEETKDFEKIIEYYRLLLMNPAATEKANSLGSALYDFLVGVVQKCFDKVTINGTEITRLLIVPDGMLNFLPFETLVDDQDKYLVETYTINYAQSLGVLDLIGKRHYTRNRNPLLAFGGAVYNPHTYQAEMIENEEQLAYLQNRASRAINQDVSLQELYGSLGYGTWKNLPGTLREVKAIEQVVDGADIMTGSAVTKSTVKELSTEGLLAHYNVLHFATHGIAVAEVPELSALVLSQLDYPPLTPLRKGIHPPSPPQGGNNTPLPPSRGEFVPALPGERDDGYLRIDEIAELKLEADFVNLSACETGLGKVYSGEGVVGLTQAFLLAGANSLSVSLWQVTDASTTDFMVALYTIVAEEGLSYADAIAEVKRRFIKADFGEQWRAPRYWAPFVYYGKG